METKKGLQRRHNTNTGVKTEALCMGLYTEKTVQGGEILENGR